MRGRKWAMVELGAFLSLVALLVVVSWWAAVTTEAVRILGVRMATLQATCSEPARTSAATVDWRKP